MKKTLEITACTLFLSGLLTLSYTTQAPEERRTFPLPVLPDVTYSIRDVIIQPFTVTLTAVNVSLFDVDAWTTICNLTVDAGTNSYHGNETCINGTINSGLALVTSTEAIIYINMFGRKSQIPSIHSMGEKYIFPEDIDKHQTDRSNSILIYSPALNTSIKLCNNHITDRHLSAKKFMSRSQKSFDRKMQCYRVNLVRDEIWMMNNLSVPDGIEVRANNPIAVLRYHVSNTSHSSENGQFMADPGARGGLLDWNIYPPLKFWGRHFVVFTKEGESMQNIFVIATENGEVTIKTPSDSRTIGVQGRKVMPISLPASSLVSITGTSNLMLYHLECTSVMTRDVFYTSIDGLSKFNHTVIDGIVGINIVCSEHMTSWMVHYTNTTKILPKKSGQYSIGNTTLYFATFSNASRYNVILVNLTGDQCFLQKTVNSHGCYSVPNINTDTNNTIKHLWESVKFDNSHPRIVSERNLSDSRSGVIIRGHITDNVNKSGGGNSSDIGLNGYQSLSVTRGSDEQITDNHTGFPYLQSIITGDTPAQTYTDYPRFGDSTAVPRLENSTLASLFTTTSANHQHRTESSWTALTNILNLSKSSGGVHRLSTGKSTQPPPGGVTTETGNGSGLNVGSESWSDVTGRVERDKSAGRPDGDSGTHTSNTDDNPDMIHDTSSGLPVTTQISSTVAHSVLELKQETPGINYSYSDLSYTNETHRNYLNRNKSKSDILDKDQSQFDFANTNRTAVGTEKQTRTLNVTKQSDSMVSDKLVPMEQAGENNISAENMQNNTKLSKSTAPWSNDRFKVVLDIVSSGNKHTRKDTRMVRYEEKNPTYVNHHDDRGNLEQVGDGKSLVAVIVSLSSALLAVITLILVFFFIEYFSRRKQIRKTRIRPFLSDF